MLITKLDGDKDVVIENRFGGEKATVPGYAAAVYDVIKALNQLHRTMPGSRRAATGSAATFQNNIWSLLD